MTIAEKTIVTKFGGTSVSSRQQWDNILAITQAHLFEKKQPVIVCSALTEASNKLDKMVSAAKLNEHHSLQTEFTQGYLQLAETLQVDAACIQADLEQLQQWLMGIALLKEAPAKTHAQIMSLGEIMMTRLGHQFLTQQGLLCLWLDARTVLRSKEIPGDDHSNYLNAYCESPSMPQLAESLNFHQYDAVITQGFIATNPQGETVLLGRGGSDTSAALFAAILGAEICEIWTDVPGIYSANPHQLPHARLLKQLNYEEAQEIASMGAKVLHPNCLPPVRRANIPLVVKFTSMPSHAGTKVSQDSDDNAPPIKSIQVKHSITLISVDSLHMWQQVGFLADVFAIFKAHGLSVDLLSSSETNVTLSLDNTTKTKDHKKIDVLMAELNQLGRAKIIEPCSAISLIGHRIRTVLPALGPVLEVFHDKQIHLVSLASNDLNLTFVIDESHADKLLQQLHHLLIESNPQSFYYSKSFHEEFGEPSQRETPWWEFARTSLLDIAQKQSPCYVYNPATQKRNADICLSMKSIDHWFYALKANAHESVLKTLYAKNISFECVSLEELLHVFKLFPEIDPKRVLFTPNFAHRNEYAVAIEKGCHLTIDSLYPLEQWPDLLKQQAIFLRLDPGAGAGHHKYVCTGGNESKFGISKTDLDKAQDLIQKNQIHVLGLHAHSGSGILTPLLWQETALFLAQEISRFPSVRILNLGGGLGVVDKPGQQALDLTLLDNALSSVKSRFPNILLWMEPGRFLVAESGVILAKVTQCKTKGKVCFIGIETGMNSLIRPTLYGAYHEIVNLSRFYDEKTKFAHIVGPICESADTLGYDRLLPDTAEGDVLLIANTGAYGHCMSSAYNLRLPAQEITLL